LVYQVTRLPNTYQTCPVRSLTNGATVTSGTPHMPGSQTSSVVAQNAHYWMATFPVSFGCTYTYNCLSCRVAFCWWTCVLLQPVPYSSVVIIHPGSLNLRIGRVSDTLPHTVPHCIARRRTPPAAGPNYEDGWLLRPEQKVTHIVLLAILAWQGLDVFICTGLPGIQFHWF